MRKFLYYLLSNVKFKFIMLFFFIHLSLKNDKWIKKRIEAQYLKIFPNKKVIKKTKILKLNYINFKLYNNKYI